MVHKITATPGSRAHRTLHAALSRSFPVRRVRRPSTDQAPAFDLAYVRTGPPSSTPALVIPGGPGLASVLPYRYLRRQAAADGLDVLMAEHRGVGLSRSDIHGEDLDQDAMWVNLVLDDFLAVLDAEGIDQVFVAGSSYGSYLAASFAARNPERVAGLMLDSALQSTADLRLERERIQSLFVEPDTELANDIRVLLSRGVSERVLLDVVRAAYELGGEALAHATVRSRLKSRIQPLWNLMASYSTRESSTLGFPYYYEFARAGAIGFRELDYGAPSNGMELDPALTYSKVAAQFPPFFEEPFDLPAVMEAFDKPLALLIGDRDVRTPPPIAYRTADLAPNSHTVTIENGHSALDTHAVAFVRVLERLVRGQVEQIPLMTSYLNALPRRGDGATFAALARKMARLPETIR